MTFNSQNNSPRTLSVHLTTCAIFLLPLLYNNAVAQDVYRRLKVIDTTAQAQYSNFPIHLECPSFWAKTEKYVQGPTSEPFYVDNCGNFIRINNVNSSIRILNVTAATSTDFVPAVANYIIPTVIYPGPNDELYINLALRSEQPRHNANKLIRFLSQDGTYLIDNNFDLPPSTTTWACQPISPDNYIFSLRPGEDINSDMAYNLFDSAGHLLRETNSMGRTPNGLEFYIDYRGRPKEDIKLIDAKSDKILLRMANPDNAFCTVLKVTNDNYVVLGILRHEHTLLADGRTLITSVPIIIIYNPQKNAYEKIDTYECKDTNYPYYNVPRVSVNYRGDIFALVIYYDVPNLIKGNERIAIYKWVRE